jgi:hypothetical protein
MPPVRFLLFVFLAAAGFGCNAAPLILAPDAAPPCLAPQVEAPCKVAEAGLPGCLPDLQSTVALGQDVVIPAGSYEAGCAVIVNSKVLDSDNQCSQIGTCHCQEDGGAFAWACYQ